MGVGLFSSAISNKARVNDLKLHYGRFRLDTWKNVFRKGVVAHWNGLPNEVVESSFLEVLKKSCRGGTQETWFSGGVGSVRSMVGLDHTDLS